MKRYAMNKYRIVYDTHRMRTIDWGAKDSIIKSSDNPIDLVEAGDLLEFANNTLLPIYEEDLPGINKYKNVVAIWKRGGNMMVRYEV